MQVSNPNNIKIYNLCNGKSLPEFLTDRKRRTLLKKDSGLRQRIELIQDFKMPTVSTTIKISPDGQFVFATGTYKPRVRCYDVNQLSLKFERCLDAEAVTFDILSEDYSKLVFLLNNRTIELHTQQGKHYNVRIPKFGRALAYNSASCDLMLVGAGSEIYRLNLEQGQFLESFKTSSPELHSCKISSNHHLLMAGGLDGRVECWDPRSRCRAGMLDCATYLQDSIGDLQDRKISALEFHGPLHMAVGTGSGQVMLYDIRSNKPFMVKDHRYELPIHSIDFNDDNDMVMSSDARAVKIWNGKTGDAVTAVELDSDINHMQFVDQSGLFFLANESEKIATFFIPMLGPAPKWCSFLDNLTEEMEENPVQEIYDDYKFLTLKEVESLGLSNLIGSSLLRAYMHGYFVDMRLYRKAMAIAKPFAYEEYRQQKIAEKIEKTREGRVTVPKSARVNRKLADRLTSRANDDDVTSGKKKRAKKEAATLLQDPRFTAMFEDSNFQVDEESEEFRLLNPVISRKFQSSSTAHDHAKDEEDDDVSGSSDEEKERKWVQVAKEAHREVHRKDVVARERRRADDSATQLTTTEAKLFSIKREGEKFTTLVDLDRAGGKQARQQMRKLLKSTLEERIQQTEGGGKIDQSRAASGGKQATFRLSKQNEEKGKRKREEEKEHREERKRVRRSAHKLQHSQKRKSSFFK